MDIPSSVAALRQDLTILREDPSLVYLDSAATSLTPDAVVDEVASYYRGLNANVHRGPSRLSQDASAKFEAARKEIASFVGVRDPELVFTANATHAINLVALGLPRQASANTVVSLLEHHSNLLPWRQRGPVKLVPVEDDVTIDLDRVWDTVDDNTDLVALTHASNVTGAVHDVKALTHRLRERGIRVLLDAAQSVPHQPVDFAQLGADYMVFSAHKMLGPTGIGALVGRPEALRALSPSIVGGGTPLSVGLDDQRYKRPPYRFEAGTPHIAGAYGFAEAARLLRTLRSSGAQEHLETLAGRLRQGIADLDGVTLLGARDGPTTGAVSFLLKGALPDRSLAVMLSDQHNIMIRAGHHCCHPLFVALQASGAARASVYYYNTVDEVDAFLEATAALCTGPR